MKFKKDTPQRKVPKPKAGSWKINKTINSLKDGARKTGGNINCQY